MNASGSTDRGGARLKQLRERLGLTLRQVEALSKQLALKKKNQDFQFAATVMFVKEFLLK